MLAAQRRSILIFCYDFLGNSSRGNVAPGNLYITFGIKPHSPGSTVGVLASTSIS